MGGSRRLQNTPMVCGNNLPTFFEISPKMQYLDVYGHMEIWSSRSRLDIWLRSGHQIQNGIFGPGPIGTWGPGPRDGPWDPDLGTLDPTPWALSEINEALEIQKIHVQTIQGRVLLRKKHPPQDPRPWKAFKNTQIIQNQ